MMNFKSPSKGEMTLKEVVLDILDYIAEDVTRCYKLIVGTDSHPHLREQWTCFVSAVVIHRLGKGARYYYNKNNIKKVKNMRQRIFYEASLSLELADKLCTCLKECGQDDMNVEIHVDIGTHGETKELVKEITGMIVGSGFNAKIKPDACAASKVADKYTK